MKGKLKIAEQEAAKYRRRLINALDTQQAILKQINELRGQDPYVIIKYWRTKLKTPLLAK